MKKINKYEFINTIQNKTKLSKEKCLIINDILENNFLLGNKNKQNIINELIINEEKAEEIYNISMNIISLSLKEKLKHPFKSQD